MVARMRAATAAAVGYFGLDSAALLSIAAVAVVTAVAAAAAAAAMLAAIAAAVAAATAFLISSRSVEASLA